MDTRDALLAALNETTMALAKLSEQIVIMATEELTGRGQSGANPFAINKATALLADRLEIDRVAEDLSGRVKNHLTGF